MIVGEGLAPPAKYSKTHEKREADSLPYIPTYIFIR